MASLEYDASGVYFSYFLMSLLGLFLFPVTWMYISYVFFRSSGKFSFSGRGAAIADVHCT